MIDRPLAVVVLAAGKGTRMRSAHPKVLHKVAGRPMIGHVVAAAESLGAAKIVVVLAPDMTEVTDAVAPHPVAIQTGAARHGRRGEGGAAGAGRLRRRRADPRHGDSSLDPHRDLGGDAARARGRETITVLAMRIERDNPYGRLVVSADGTLERIVEALDATEAERMIALCNSGVMLIDGEHLFPTCSLTPSARTTPRANIT